MGVFFNVRAFLRNNLEYFEFFVPLPCQRKKDEICGLTGRQKLPSARAGVFWAKPKTESFRRRVKIINFPIERMPSG